MFLFHRSRKQFRPADSSYVCSLPPGSWRILVNSGRIWVQWLRADTDTDPFHRSQRTWSRRSYSDRGHTVHVWRCQRSEPGDTQLGHKETAVKNGPQCWETSTLERQAANKQINKQVFTLVLARKKISGKQNQRCTQFLDVAFSSKMPCITHQNKTYLQSSSKCICYLTIWSFFIFLNGFKIYFLKTCMYFSSRQTCWAQTTKPTIKSNTIFRQNHRMTSSKLNGRGKKNVVYKIYFS